MKSLFKYSLGAFILPFIISGCYESNRPAIDADYEKTLDKLNIDCRNNDSDWCKNMYSRAERNYQEKMREDTTLVHQAKTQMMVGVLTTVGILLITGVVVGTLCAPSDSHHGCFSN